ncbi:hypothetical protein RJ639_016404 [Escallonia herrerae]|uniref:Transposase (putative) gypsy type domain-containing protein n=1 Tax=Escallonia herrerae TaxID=1293975 RepID=A0AA88VHU7_9ASTE|nr:hypothetical protein RJ639_016404 [Escallonia herrerae]
MIERNSVRTEFCSAIVTLLGQSVRTGFCSARILLGCCHSARAECSDGILFGQNSTRPSSLCLGRVFQRDSARPLSLCSGRVFGPNSVRTEFCSAVVTLLGQNVWTGFYSYRILLGRSFQVFLVCLEDMSESSVSVSSPEEDVVISSSSSSRSGDVKDQAEDEANPKPWYTVDKKSSKMSIEDLVALLREYPLSLGWYARLPGLQEPANYGTKYETRIYEEQVRSGYRLSLHPFAIRFFEHYHMAPGQLVPNGWRKLVGLIYLVQTSGYKPDTTDFMRDFENPGKPAPNNLTKHILNHIKLRGGLFIDEPLSEQQLEWARIIPRMLVPAGAVTPPPAPTISSTFPVESASLEMASGSGKTPQGGFLGVLQKAKGKRKEKQPSAKLPPALKKTRVIPPDHSLQIVENVSVKEDPIFCPRWTLRSNDVGMPDSQISEQHLIHGVLPRDKEIFQNQTHETFACSFAQAVYTMYASGSKMLSRFEMARQVAIDEAQQKREALKEAEEATRRAEELSKQETDYLAQIETLERRLERAKRRVAEEVKKARDQGIRDFLDGNAGDEWLKKRADDGLEIYELGFAKAKEMFAERFLDIPLGDFVLPAMVFPSGETVMPSDAGDAAASHLPGEGPSSDAPEL